MKWSNSKTLFNVNQELKALSNSSNRFYSKLECFTIEKIDPNPKMPVRAHSGTPGSFTGVFPISASPSGKHFYILKETLSTAFPDFDFSNLTQDDFKRVTAPEQMKSNLSWQLNSSLTSADIIESHLWQGIETEITPGMCDIYQYEPNYADVFSESGAVWSYTYFFINEKQKKSMILHLREGADDFASDSGDEDSYADDGDLLESRFGFGVF